MKLVVTTNSNTCRIYYFLRKPPELTLLKEIYHPENKLKNSELNSDKPGHYMSSMSARGAYSSRSETKEVDIDNFSREIARELNKERINKDYNALILIAPPQMIGLLFAHIDKHVKDLLINKIEKNLIYMPDHELLKFLLEINSFE